MQLKNALPQHQCLIYEGAPSGHLDSLAQTIIDKLKINQRCLYLNSPAMVAGMRSKLFATGLDVTEEVHKGALILSSDQGHLLGGKFDVDRMLGLLSNALMDALANGYSALWATGDMTWEFGSEHNMCKMLEYERKLEEFMQENPALGGVCLYHRDTLPDHAIATAYEAHKALYINQTLSLLNPQYQCGNGECI